jgi:hypothetical protein
VVPTPRVQPVDRLVKITRDGDRPSRDAEERRRRALRAQSQPEADDQEPGEGHIDIRV